MLSVTLNLSQLKNTTLAAIVADLIENDGSRNNMRGIVKQLEINVGYEDAIKYLVDAGVTPEDIDRMEEYA